MSSKIAKQFCADLAKAPMAGQDYNFLCYQEILFLYNSKISGFADAQKAAVKSAGLLGQKVK